METAFFVMLFGLVAIVSVSAGMLCGTFIWRRVRGRRWNCQSCDHGVSSHMNDAADIGACNDGVGGIGAAMFGGCRCQAFIGPVPAARRIHHTPPPQPQPEAVEDTEEAVEEVPAPAASA